MENLKNKRVKVKGGYNESEYTAFGYSSNEYYQAAPGEPFDEQLLLVRLDSGSYHYYNVDDIEIVPDSFSG